LRQQTTFLFSSGYIRYYKTKGGRPSGRYPTLPRKKTRVEDGAPDGGGLYDSSKTSLVPAIVSTGTAVVARIEVVIAEIIGSGIG